MDLLSTTTCSFYVSSPSSECKRKRNKDERIKENNGVREHAMSLGSTHPGWITGAQLGAQPRTQAVRQQKNKKDKQNKLACTHSHPVSY